MKFSDLIKKALDVTDEEYDDYITNDIWNSKKRRLEPGGERKTLAEWAEYLKENPIKNETNEEGSETPTTQLGNTGGVHSGPNGGNNEGESAVPSNGGGRAGDNGTGEHGGVSEGAGGETSTDDVPRADTGNGEENGGNGTNGESDTTGEGGGNGTEVEVGGSTVVHTGGVLESGGGVSAGSVGRNPFGIGLTKSDVTKEKVPYTPASDPDGKHAIGNTVVPSGIADAMNNAFLALANDVQMPIVWREEDRYVFSLGFRRAPEHQRSARNIGKLSKMELTKEQKAFYIIWRLQGATDYQIAIYLMLLENPDLLHQVMVWIENHTKEKNKFPSESDLVQKIHQILKSP